MAMMKVSRNWPSGIIGRTASTAVWRSTVRGTGALASGQAAAAPAVRAPEAVDAGGPLRRCSGGRSSRTVAAPTGPASDPPTGDVRGSASKTPGIAWALGSRPVAMPDAASGDSWSGGTAGRPSASIERAPHDLVHQRLLAEPHLGLRRVHVDVDAIGRHLDEQMHLGAALLDRRDAVGVDDGVRDRPVLDDAAVDEDVLRPARRSLLGERGDEAGDA